MVSPRLPAGAGLASASPRKKLASALRRSADTHDATATLLDAQDRPQRAAWHRNVARVDRARADRIETTPKA